MKPPSGVPYVTGTSRVQICLCNRDHLLSRVRTVWHDGPRRATTYGRARGYA